MHEDWIARWSDGRIGFHEGHTNTLLDRHIVRFAGRRRVLVPLCGRAEDLAFLAARGHMVVGIELAEQAVREFFASHALVPSIAARGPLVAYTVHSWWIAASMAAAGSGHTTPGRAADGAPGRAIAQPRRASSAIVAAKHAMPEAPAQASADAPNHSPAAVHSVHRRLVKPSTRSPGLNTRPSPRTRWSA